MEEERFLANVCEYAENVYKMYKIDGSYSRDGVMTNVKVWHENKQNLCNLLKRHPCWNENAQAIVFKNTERREVNRETTAKLYKKLFDYIKDKVCTSEDTRQLMREIYWMLKGSDEPTLQQTDIDYLHVSCRNIPAHVESILRVGVRKSKLVNKVYSELVTADGSVVNATTIEDSHADGDRSYTSYQKLYASFADSLSELTIDKFTILSINFADFMLMSNGNSWSSCHYINSHGIFHEDAESSYHGMYKQGCLSYALDDCSFIFYTLPDTYTGEDYAAQPKLNRMCCQYKNGVLVTGKLYPDNDTEKSDQYRQLIQKVLADCESRANTWTMSRSIKRIGQFVRTADNSGHYCDYEYETQKPTVSLLKPFVVNDVDDMCAMTIGHTAYCLECGCELNGDNHDKLQCYHHSNVHYCAKCGERLYEDEGHEIDGDWYCDDCCFYCDYHEEWETDEYMEVDNGTVCMYAYENYYTRCKKCGSIVLTENMHEDMCDTCYIEHLREIKKYTEVCTDGLVQKEQYDVGDYVVIKYDEDCEHMDLLLNVGNVGKIVDTGSYSMRVQLQRGRCVRAGTSTMYNAIAGCIMNKSVTDDMIGLKYTSAMAVCKYPIGSYVRYNGLRRVSNVTLQDNGELMYRLESMSGTINVTESDIDSSMSVQMATELKVGDVVQMADDFTNCPFGYNPDMNGFIGRVGKVVKVSDFNGINRYNIQFGTQTTRYVFSKTEIKGVIGHED